jgi:cytochrome c553
MNRSMKITAAIIAIALSSVATAADVEAGKTKSQPCQACHGTDGNPTDPQYPRLAGQYRDYLEQAMTDYKSGARANPIMLLNVQPLSKQDIADLAAYYASLPSKLSDLSKLPKAD